MVLFRKAAWELFGCPPTPSEVACSFKLVMALDLASNGQLASRWFQPMRSSMNETSLALSRTPLPLPLPNKEEAGEEEGPPPPNLIIVLARRFPLASASAAAAAALCWTSRMTAWRRCLFEACKRRQALMEVSRTSGPRRERGTTMP